MSRAISSRLDKLESASGGKSRVVPYHVGFGYPEDKLTAWLEEQRESGVVGKHDLMVGLVVFSDEFEGTTLRPPSWV